MTITELIEKHYKGDLVFFSDAQQWYQHFPDPTESESQHMKSIFDIDEGGNFVLPEGPCKSIFDDGICGFRNAITTAEIHRFKGKLIQNMQDEQREAVIKEIKRNIDRFDVKPVAYEMTRDSIVLVWYLAPFADTFMFVEDIGLIPSGN